MVGMYNPKAGSRARYGWEMLESTIKIYQVKGMSLLLLKEIKAKLENVISKLENIKRNTGNRNRSKYAGF